MPPILVTPILAHLHSSSVLVLTESGGKRHSLGIHAGKNQMTALIASAPK